MTKANPKASIEYMRKDARKHIDKGAVTEDYAADRTALIKQLNHALATELDLPLYNQDDDVHQAPSVLRMKSQIQEAQGLLFVTPEYNRSIPGVLKNAIDHASRPYGQSVWDGKPAGVMGASVGAIGTSLAQQHLRNILAYLNVPTLGQPEAFIHAKEGFFDAQDHIGEGSLAFMQGWMDHYALWVRKHLV
jgi:chromate reductase